MVAHLFFTIMKELRKKGDILKYKALYSTSVECALHFIEQRNNKHYSTF